MIQILLNKKTPGKIGYFELDATVRETHEYVNTITEFPLEKGFNASDHVIRSPERLTIEGFVTNSPVPHSISSLRSIIDRSDRVNTALEAFLDMAGFDPAGKEVSEVTGSGKIPQFIEVITGLRKYKNMVITKLTIPRDKDTGTNSMRFNIELRHMIIVSSSTVLIENTSNLNGKAPNIEKQAPKTENKNVQTTTSAKEQAQSWLFSLENYLANRK
jgi:hypothetical protein